MKFTREAIRQSLVPKLHLLERGDINVDALSRLMADHIIGLIELELKYGAEKSMNDIEKMSVLLEIPEFEIVIEIDPIAKSGRIFHSNLKQGLPPIDEEDVEFLAAMDAIESMILAHACAGIDITEEAYINGIRTAVEACANNL
jgi:hypothetical protein